MMQHASRGFTLIEVMIAVAIVGILAAIAYPSYTEHVRSSRRADCKTVLLSVANALERRFTSGGSYPAEVPGGIESCPVDGGTTFYVLEYEGENDSFTLTATPQGAQAEDKCGTLSLTSNGQRTPTTAGCW